MAEDPRAAISRNIRDVVAEVYRSASDDALLRRFVEGGEETAFAALMRRHGPMVLGVCRRALRDCHNAEDVFQATFLILARKAPSVLRRDSLPSWLYGVAHRLALRSRADAARRRRHERSKPAGAPTEAEDRLAWDEVRVALDEELARLPERLRSPLVLCYLQGRTQDEAARQLGWALNTLRRRLARARELLGLRLTHRGVSLAAGFAAVLLSEPVAVADKLARATVPGCLAVAAGARPTDVAPAEVAALTEGGLRTMTRLRLTTALVFMLLLGAGAGLLALQSDEARPPAPPADAPTKDQPRGVPAPRAEKLDQSGDPLPAGAVARMGTLRFRQGHWIYSLAFSPDGTLLASGGHQGNVRYWDVATGRERLPQFNRHPGLVSALAISPDGKLLASAGNEEKSIRLSELATGKEIRRIGEHAAGLLCFGPRFSSAISLALPASSLAIRATSCSAT